MNQLQHFESFMQELYKTFHAHDLQQTERLQRYRNIEPESGRFYHYSFVPSSPNVFWKLGLLQAIPLYGWPKLPGRLKR